MYEGRATRYDLEKRYKFIMGKKGFTQSKHWKRKVNGNQWRVLISGYKSFSAAARTTHIIVSGIYENSVTLPNWQFQDRNNNANIP